MASIYLYYIKSPIRPARPLDPPQRPSQSDHYEPKSHPHNVRRADKQACQGKTAERMLSGVFEAHCNWINYLWKPRTNASCAIEFNIDTDPPKSEYWDIGLYLWTIFKGLTSKDRKLKPISRLSERAVTSRDMEISKEGLANVPDCIWPTLRVVTLV